MNSYKLNFNIPSPGDSLSFIEFSPDGRLLAVGDRDRSVLFILDKLAGFHPTISFITLAIPTALVWETTETFYVGLSDGNFVHYRINLKDNTLVEGVVDSSLYYEGFPITAMALDVGSKTLIMSVGPGVFAFRRICATSKSRSLVDRCGKLTRFEANSISLHVSRPAFISRVTQGPPHHHFQGPFVSHLTMSLSSHSVGNI